MNDFSIKDRKVGMEDPFVAPFTECELNMGLGL